jgi:hypothetical protein
MKKLPPSARAKVQNSLQQKRNYQVGGTKKRAAHLPARCASETPPGSPVSKKSKTEKTGMIALRVQRITKRLVASMADCPGASFETHAEACEVGLETFYRWMRNGEEDPDGIYGKFRQAMLRSMAKGEKVLHKAAMRTHAIHLLARRFPHHYPSERQLMEISAPGGLPLIPSENQFNVTIELHTVEQSVPPLENKPFQIVGLDGQRQQWNGSNGQEADGRSGGFPQEN